MKTQSFTVVVEEDEAGFVVECPDFQGCYTQGDTYEEALANIKDLIQLHLQRSKDAKPAAARHLRGISLRTVEVAA